MESPVLELCLEEAGGWLCVSVIPGKDDVYSSSEEQVAGRGKQVQEGHFWVDETA